MRSIFFDAIHTTKKWSTVFILIFVILISMLGASSFSVGVPHPDNSKANLYMTYYLKNDTYHVVNYFYNTYGDPISKMPVSFTGSVSLSKTTDTAGYANLSYGTSNLAKWYNITEEYTYGGVKNSYHLTLNKISIFNHTSQKFLNQKGVVTSRYSLCIPQCKSNCYDPLIGTYSISTVYNKTNPYLSNLMVFYVGLNGSKSNSINVTFVKQLRTYISNDIINMRINSNFYVARVVPPESKLSTDAAYGVRIDSKNTKNAVPSQAPIGIINPGGLMFGGFILKLPTAQQQLASDASSYINSFFSVILGIVAAFITFSTFTNITNSGVYESIISKPISRKELIASRYGVSIFLMLMISVMAIISMDIYGYLKTGFFINNTDTGLLIVSMFLTSAALISLFFILSGITKRDVSFIGISVMLSMILSLFWSPIISSIAVNSTHYVATALSSQNILVGSNYFTPFGPIYLSYYYLNFHTATLISTRFNPTIPYIIILGILWVVILAILGMMINSKAK
jgi:ABC-type transport system involved in multi-copper enzyme maturation permease subunit